MRNLNEYKAIVEENLLSYIPEVDDFAGTVSKAMAYSLEAGGKRLRPSLLLASSEFAGGDINEAIPYACALEFIHTYSLIHDDLPAMDNDDLRRGKPTNHKVFGEAMAILAGDGLLNAAFEIMYNELLKHTDDLDKMALHAKAGQVVAKAAGICGMIGGQTADIENETKVATAELVSFIEANKTGALLTAPVVAGFVLAGANDDVISDFKSYAEDIGKAFQISDDILDIEGDEKLLGKKLGKDLDAGKCNYACVHGLENAKDMLHKLTARAKETLAKYGASAQFFVELADILETRKA